ncbi:AGAP009413-PA [Anopheles gambiae str. PEST]|uniref:AGAP009413-PA n=2 Tax=gambiae species complex TaxID=44542 RepID=Q7PSF3_ANOGA|nr:AGAP009413-PA [Anopheles gambiae str. PEST]
MLRLSPEDPKAVMPFAKRLLRLSGFRQETEQLEKQIFFNLFVYVAALLIPKVCSPYPDSEAIIRGLSELIFFTNVYVGYYCFVVQHRHYRDLLDEIQSFVNVVYPTSQQPESPSERTLIKLNVKINKISVLYCWYLAAAGLIYWSTPCLMTYHSVLKAKAEYGPNHPIRFYPNLEGSFYGLDNRTSVYGYAAFSIVALLVFAFASYNNATKLLTILSTIKYCSTLLQLVGVEVDNLNHTSSEAIGRELKKVIQLHQLALRCVALLNQTLSFVMALQLALCILTWCFTLLYILIVGFNAIATNGLLIMINMTLEMFGYCFFCTELDTTGKIVSRQMYEFRWEQHRPTVQKMVAMIIARSQTPLQITACGFIPINLELFTKVVKHSYTVLAVLKDLI